MYQSKRPLNAEFRASMDKGRAWPLSGPLPERWIPREDNFESVRNDVYPAMKRGYAQSHAILSRGSSSLHWTKSTRALPPTGPAR